MRFLSIQQVCCIFSQLKGFTLLFKLANTYLPARPMHDWFRLHLYIYLKLIKRQNEQRFFAFTIHGWRMFLHVWLRLETGTPDRCHTSKSCCCHCYQLIGSLSNYSVKRARNRSRGNKTTTAINIKRACGGAGECRLTSWLVNQDIEIAIDLTRFFSDGPYCGLEKDMGHSCVNEHWLLHSIKHPLRYTTIVTKQRIN